MICINYFLLRILGIHMHTGAYPQHRHWVEAGPRVLCGEEELAEEELGAGPWTARRDGGDGGENEGQREDAELEVESKREVAAGSVEVLG